VVKAESRLVSTVAAGLAATTFQNDQTLTTFITPALLSDVVLMFVIGCGILARGGTE
jgi:hypothetical protein